MIASPQFEFIRSKVQALAMIAEPIVRRLMEETPDPFQFEDADRRSLGYEFHTEHRTLSTWMLNFTRESNPECTALFNEVWEHLLGLLVMRFFTFDTDFGAPAKSLG